MKIGISQLGIKDPEHLNQILETFSGLITHLEIVPAKFFARDQEYLEVLSKFGVLIESAQSIVYGTQLESFHDPMFVDTIIDVVEQCKSVGVSKYVLGAPGLRKINNHSLSSLIPIFATIGQSIPVDSVIYIEPNAPVYKGDYFYSPEEVYFFTQSDSVNINRPLKIKTMIDTGNCFLLGVSSAITFEKMKNAVSHIHVSEKDINLSFSESEEHFALAESLKTHAYQGILIYETLNMGLSDTELFLKTYKNS